MSADDFSGETSASCEVNCETAGHSCEGPTGEHHEVASHYVHLTEMCDNSVICDTNGNLNPDTSAIASGVQTFQTADDSSDTISTYSDSYSNSDYIDTVNSADSSSFLLPRKDESEDICMTNDAGKASEISGNETVIEDKCCFDNKQYTDSVSSNTLSIQPLLTKTDSIWSFAREFEIAAPVIGHIDHPGFICSQADISSNSNLSFACQKALKYLQDERVASSLLLPGSYKDLSKQPPEDSKEDGEVDHNIVPSGRHTRNLIALCVCNCLLFIACGSLRNLQSSLNHEEGVGITSLAVSCFGYVLGSIFSPFFVQNFDPYRCLIASLFPHLMFIGANFYPKMWLMLPISFLQGVSGAVLWNAMSTYVTFLAKGFSEKRKESYENVLNRFFGIFCLAYQLYMIFGNLIASLVLTYANPIDTVISNVSSFNESLSNSTFDIIHSDSPYSTHELTSPTDNSTPVGDVNSTSGHLSLCGAQYCHHYAISNSGTVVSEFAKYLLFGIYIALMLCSLFIAVFLLERLNRRLFSSVMTVGMVKTHLVSLGKFALNRNFLLLCPFLLFSSMEAGFATAEITKAFVTCPVGVHMVGYTMICMGVSGSISAYMSGWLTRVIGRTVLIGIAVTLNLGLLAFMAIWRPQADSLVELFVLIGVWGLADGIWMAQSNSLMGILFPEKFEEAFTGLRVMQGLGSSIAFAYAQSFCMASKIYIMAAVCIASMSGYLISEHLLKKQRQASIKTVYSAEEV